ncbi:TPA: hypothetical protein ACXK4S_000659 [Pseudomonas aeruginosa]
MSIDTYLYKIKKETIRNEIYYMSGLIDMDDFGRFQNANEANDMAQIHLANYIISRKFKSYRDICYDENKIKKDPMPWANDFYHFSKDIVADILNKSGGIEILTFGTIENVQAYAKFNSKVYDLNINNASQAMPEVKSLKLGDDAVDISTDNWKLFEMMYADKFKSITAESYVKAVDNIYSYHLEKMEARDEMIAASRAKRKMKSGL